MNIYVVQRITMTDDGCVSTKIKYAFYTHDEALAYIEDVGKLDEEAVKDGNCDFTYVYQIHRVWLN